MRYCEFAHADEIILYLDAGIEIIRPITPLAEFCRDNGGIWISRNHERINRCWTKRDCFALLGCDDPAYHNHETVNAGFIAVAATDRAANFIDEWLHHCTDPRKLTDIPSTCGLPELPDFIQHRHDQSILALVAQQWQLTLHRDPSQFGNHVKPPALREVGEVLLYPYSQDNHVPSPYPTLLNLHRRQANRRSLVPRTVQAIKTRLRSVTPSSLWRLAHGLTTRTPVTVRASELATAISRNRQALCLIPDWFDPAADARSTGGYGVTAYSQPILSKPVGPRPTLPDLLVSLADRFGERLRYLETGISVGKNFHQLIHAGRGRTLVGFDIEEPHPNLTRQFEVRDRVEWPTPTESIKRGRPASPRSRTSAGGTAFATSRVTYSMTGRGSSFKAQGSISSSPTPSTPRRG